MRKYYPCHCCDIHHCLVVERFDDLDDQVYSLMGIINRQQTVKDRLKCIWNILRGDECITAEVMLSMKNVVKLRNDLTTIIESVEKKQKK